VPRWAGDRLPAAMIRFAPARMSGSLGQWRLVREEAGVTELE